MKGASAMLLGVCLVVVVSACGSTCKRVARPGPGVQEKGWFISGGGRKIYTASVDRETTRGLRPAILLTRATEVLGKYGTWMTSVDACAYGGKRVRFSAYTKTSGTTVRADFWARVQAKGSPGDGSGLGGQWINLSASSPWTRQEIVLDVPENGHKLQYGVGVSGPGKLWLEGPGLEVVGKDVPITVQKK